MGTFICKKKNTIIKHFYRRSDRPPHAQQVSWTSASVSKTNDLKLCFCSGQQHVKVPPCMLSFLNTPLTKIMPLESLRTTPLLESPVSLFTNLHHCLAMRAKLKASRSLNPSSFEIHRVSHAFQWIPFFAHVSCTPPKASNHHTNIMHECLRKLETIH